MQDVRVRLFTCFACGNPCILIASDCDGRHIPECPFGHDEKLREVVLNPEPEKLIERGVDA